MTFPTGDDLLTRASRALRDETERDASGGIEAWQGMHGWRDLSGDVRRAARRRRRALIGALQLVAALGGVGAWAAVSGRLPDLFSRRRPAADQPTPGPSGRARAHAARVRSLAADPPSTAEEIEPPVAPGPVAPAPAEPPPLQLQPSSPSHVAHHPVAMASPRPPAAAAPPSGPDPDDIYRQAHHEHFVRRDYAAALALWDRYLAAGGGSLVLEARFNRAIALVRLHRREDAIAALAPFAAGDHRGYRQRESQDLLRMLEVAPPPP